MAARLEEVSVVEVEVGEIRAEYLERWMGVSGYWDAECRKLLLVLRS